MGQSPLDRANCLGLFQEGWGAFGAIIRALFTVSQLLMGEIAVGAVFGCGSVGFGLDLSKRPWLLLWVMKGPGVGRSAQRRR